MINNPLTRRLAKSRLISVIGFLVAAGSLAALTATGIIFVELFQREVPATNIDGSWVSIGSVFAENRFHGIDLAIARQAVDRLQAKRFVVWIATQKKASYRDIETDVTVAAINQGGPPSVPFLAPLITKRGAIISYRLWSQLGSPADIVGAAIGLGGAQITVLGVAPPEAIGVTFDQTIDVWLPFDLRFSALFPDFSTDLVDEITDYRLLIDTAFANSLAASADKIAGLSLSARSRFVGGGATVRHLTRLPRPFVNAEAWDEIKKSAFIAALFSVVLVLVSLSSLFLLFLTISREREREWLVRKVVGAKFIDLLKQAALEAFFVALAVSLGVLALLLPAIRLITELPGLTGFGSSVYAGFTSIFLTTACAFLVWIVVTAAQLTGFVRTGVFRESSTLSGSPAVQSAGSMIAVVPQAILTIISVSLLGLMWLELSSLRRPVDGLNLDKLYTVEVISAGERIVPEASRAETVQFLAQSEISIHKLALATVIPGGGYGMITSIDTAFASSPLSTVNVVHVSRNFFDVLGIPFLYGSTWTKGSDHVVVLSTSASRLLFGNENAVGRDALKKNFGRGLRVVGVVRDVQYAGPRLEQLPTVYLPIDHFGISGNIIIKAGDRVSDVDDLTLYLQKNFPNKRLGSVREVSRVWNVHLTTERSYLALSVLVSLAAVVVSLLSMIISTRRSLSVGIREIAIRLALGLPPTGVRRLLFLRLLKAICIGGAISTIIIFLVWASEQLAVNQPTRFWISTWLVALFISTGIAGGAVWAATRQINTLPVSKALNSE